MEANSCPCWVAWYPKSLPKPVQFVDQVEESHNLNFKKMEHTSELEGRGKEAASELGSDFSLNVYKVAA